MRAVRRREGPLCERENRAAGHFGSPAGYCLPFSCRRMLLPILRQTCRRTVRKLRLWQCELHSSERKRALIRLSAGWERAFFRKKAKGPTAVRKCPLRCVFAGPRICRKGSRMPGRCSKRRRPQIAVVFVPEKGDILGKMHLLMLFRTKMGVFLPGVKMRAKI